MAVQQGSPTVLQEVVQQQEREQEEQTCTPQGLSKLGLQGERVGRCSTGAPHLLAADGAVLQYLLVLLLVVVLGSRVLRVLQGISPTAHTPASTNSHSRSSSHSSSSSAGRLGRCRRKRSCSAHSSITEAFRASSSSSSSRGEGSTGARCRSSSRAQVLVVALAAMLVAALATVLLVAVWGMEGAAGRVGVREPSSSTQAATALGTQTGEQQVGAWVVVAAARAVRGCRTVAVGARGLVSSGGALEPMSTRRMPPFMAATEGAATTAAATEMGVTCEA